MHLCRHYSSRCYQQRWQYSVRCLGYLAPSAAPVVSELAAGTELAAAAGSDAAVAAASAVTGFASAVPTV